MLVITRREGEEVVIGDPRNPIGVVRIASIKGDRVRVAFDFPRTIEVHRREVADQIAGDGKPEVVVVAGRDAEAAERNGRAGERASDRITGEIEIELPGLNGHSPH
jgi:carbon storage regulator